MIPAARHYVVTGALAQVLWSEDEVVITGLAERCKGEIGSYVEQSLARLRMVLDSRDEMFARFIDERLKVWQAGSGSLLRRAPASAPGNASRSLARQGQPEASTTGQRHPRLRLPQRAASTADVRPLAAVSSVAVSTLEPEEASPFFQVKPTLPPLETTLVDRADPMTRLRELAAARSGTIVISGIPGAGKRTLAMQLGHHLPDAEFAGGKKLFVADRDEVRMQDIVLRLWDEFMGTTPPFSNPEVVGHRLRDALSTRERMLIILENVRNASTALTLRQALPHTALILITSEATHLAADIGAQGVHVGGMSSAEARALFANVLDRSPADFRDCGWLDDLLAELEGHPLFLQIAARRLRRCRDTSEWPATAIKLRDIARSGLMPEDGGESALRGRSPDQILTRILEPLPEELCDKAILLSAMAPGVAFDTRGAAALWEVNDTEARRALVGLFEAGVLTAIPPRADDPLPLGADAVVGTDEVVPAWRQPAAIRSLCLEILTSKTDSLSDEPGSARAKAARRHAQHYVAGVCGGQYRIAATLPQLRHAMDWALDANDFGVCYELFAVFMHPRVCMFVARELITWSRRLPKEANSDENAPADLLSRLFQAIASLVGAAVDPEDHARRVEDVVEYCNSTLRTTHAVDDPEFRMFLLSLKSRALCARGVTSFEVKEDLEESLRVATEAWTLLSAEHNQILRGFVAFSFADAQRLIGMISPPLPADRRQRMIEAYDVAIECWQDAGRLSAVVRSCRALALIEDDPSASVQEPATCQRALADVRAAFAECVHEDDRPIRGMTGICLAQALLTGATAENVSAESRDAYLTEANTVCTQSIACLDSKLLPLLRSVAFFTRAIVRFLRMVHLGHRQDAYRALDDLREADALLKTGGPGTIQAELLCLHGRIALSLAFEEKDEAAGIKLLEDSMVAIDRALAMLPHASEGFPAVHYLRMIAGTILVVSEHRPDLVPPIFASAQSISEASTTAEEERTQALNVKLDMLMRLKDFPGENARIRIDEALETVEALRASLSEEPGTEVAAMVELARAAILYERGRRMPGNADADYDQVCELCNRVLSFLGNEADGDAVREAAHLWRMIAQRASGGGLAIGPAVSAFEILRDRTKYLESIANRGPQMWYPHPETVRNCVSALLSPESGAIPAVLRAQLRLLEAGVVAEAAIAGIQPRVGELQEAVELAEEACRLLAEAGDLTEESSARLAKMNLAMTLAALGDRDRRAALQQIVEECSELCQRLDPEHAPELWLALHCRQSASLLLLASLPGEERQERITQSLRALWTAFVRLEENSFEADEARAALRELRAMGADGFDTAWQTLRLGDCPEWLSAADPVVRERTFVLALEKFVEVREDASRNYFSVEKWKTAAEAGGRLQQVAERPEYRDRLPSLAQDLAATYVGLGEALARSGQQEKALKKFEKAERLDPTDPDVRRHSIGILIELGRLREAQSRLWTCARLSDRLEWYAELRQRLDAANRSAMSS